MGQNEMLVIINFMGYDLTIIIMQNLFFLSLHRINTNVIHLFVVIEYQCHD
jgi:hypothetical protein